MGYIPWVYKLWQVKGFGWLERPVERLDELVAIRTPWRLACEEFFGSHGCDKRKDRPHKVHRCGVHWAWRDESS